MFNVGDVLTYTGDYRDACEFVKDPKSGYGGPDGWVLTKTGSSGIIYAKNKGGTELGFYAKDMRLSGPVVPEEYEAWFV